MSRLPPRSSVLPLLEIDEVAVARLLQEQLTEGMPPNVARLRVTLRPETIDGAYYHYVHGLKKHQGQCQRIAHGHRSRLEITVDGARDTAMEQEIAVAWTDIYLGSREDEAWRRNGRVRYAYRAAEGRFRTSNSPNPRSTPWTPTAPSSGSPNTWSSGSGARGRDKWWKCGPSRG